MVEVDRDSPLPVEVYKDWPMVVEPDKDSTSVVELDKDSPLVVEVDKDSPLLVILAPSLNPLLWEGSSWPGRTTLFWNCVTATFLEFCILPNKTSGPAMESNPA